MKLQDKTIVVTGGGNGIGRALVLALLKRGSRVAAVDLREESLKETARMAGAGERLSLHTVDITDRARVLALPDEIVAHHGVVDGLINNAGIIQPFIPLKDLDFEAIDRVVNVNFYGTLNMVKAFLPLLLARPEAHILNVSSMGGLIPVPGQSVYGATKAAVKLMSEGLYAELMDTQVGVSVAMPGATATEITQNSGIEGLKTSEDAKGLPMTSPEDAAEIMLKGIEAKRLHILVGTDARLFSLAARVAPVASLRFIQRQMKKLLPL